MEPKCSWKSSSSLALCCAFASHAAFRRVERIGSAQYRYARHSSFGGIPEVPHGRWHMAPRCHGSRSHQGQGGAHGMASLPSLWRSGLRIGGLSFQSNPSHWAVACVTRLEGCLLVRCRSRGLALRGMGHKTLCD